MSAPARILYCESSADGTIGGSHYCLLNLVEHVDRTRFQPVALFYEEHALLQRFRAAAETIVHPQDAPVTWGRSGATRLAARGVNLTRFLGAVASHIALLRRHRIAILHLNNSITRHQDWMLAAHLTGIPCIVSERGLNDVYTASARWFASRVAAIVPMSGWIRDHMVARGVPADNVRVIYDGLDPALLKPLRTPEQIREAWQVRPEQRLFGIVGNIRAWKGQETVVRAVIETARRFPDIVCLVVGSTTPSDEPYKAQLLAALRQAGLESAVRFTGYQADVPSFMNAMEFVIHASVQPEPFGMVVLEAMAQRRAVIGSRAGGVVEMVVEGKTGLTFPPGDSRALANQLSVLLENREQTKRMGEAGYERLVARFTLSRCLEQFHAIYQAALDRKPLPDGAAIPPVLPRATGSEAGIVR